MCALIPRCPLFKLKKKAQKTNEGWQRKAISPLRKGNSITKCLKSKQRCTSVWVHRYRHRGQLHQCSFIALLLSDLHMRPCYSSIFWGFCRTGISYVLNLIKINVSALLSLHKIFKRLQLKAIRERSIRVLTMCTTFSYLFQKIKIKQLLLSSHSHPPTTNSVWTNPPSTDVKTGHKYYSYLLPKCVHLISHYYCNTGTITYYMWQLLQLVKDRAT